MKFLGVAVAFLVLAVSLEYANAVPIPCGSYPDVTAEGVRYYEYKSTVTYAEAVELCGYDDAEVMTSALARDLIPSGSLDNYWVESDSTNGSCQYYGNGSLHSCGCGDKLNYICYCGPEETTTTAPPTTTAPTIPPEEEGLMEASICGDPIVSTFDNATIALVRPGMYELTFDPWNDPCAYRMRVMLFIHGHPWFHVHIYGLWMTFGGVTYSIYPYHLHISGVGWIWLHCQPWTLVHYSLGFPNIFIYWDHNCCLVFVSTDCHFRFRWCLRSQHYHCARVSVGERYRGMVTGIFGNFNGNTDDDYNTSDGVNVAGQRDRYVRIGESYTVNATMMPPPTTTTERDLSESWETM